MASTELKSCQAVLISSVEQTGSLFKATDLVQRLKTPGENIYCLSISGHCRSAMCLGEFCPLFFIWYYALHVCVCLYLHAYLHIHYYTHLYKSIYTMLDEKELSVCVDIKPRIQAASHLTLDN